MEWGIKTFENDDAYDWLLDLEESNDLSLLVDAFEKDNSDYIETPEGSNILAAAEIVLGLIGNARSGLPEKAQTWIFNNKSKLKTDELKEKAVKAIDRVLSKDSELNELWSESEEDYQSWLNDVKQLKLQIENCS